MFISCWSLNTCQHGRRHTHTCFLGSYTHNVFLGHYDVEVLLNIVVVFTVYHILRKQHYSLLVDAASSGQCAAVQEKAAALASAAARTFSS